MKIDSSSYNKAITDCCQLTHNMYEVKHSDDNGLKDNNWDIMDL